MSKHKSTKRKDRVREMVPCILAFLIFVVPLVVFTIVFPIAGLFYAIVAGVATYFIILGICILIWWVERPKK